MPNLSKDVCLRKVVPYLLVAPFSSHNLFFFTPSSYTLDPYLLGFYSGKGDALLKQKHAFQRLASLNGEEKQRAEVTGLEENTQNTLLVA
ncbi:hypothetical protein EK904_006960 [Melospiza melodia maxima]|nr:hypothetical protein EK904_006960 [Melospiza melodia maxima]